MCNLRITLSYILQPITDAEVKKINAKTDLVERVARKAWIGVRAGLVATPLGICGGLALKWLASSMQQGFASAAGASAIESVWTTHFLQPFREELALRGFAQPLLIWCLYYLHGSPSSRKAQWIGISATALLFGVRHRTFSKIGSSICAGFITGYLREKTRRPSRGKSRELWEMAWDQLECLVAPISSHIIYNLVVSSRPILFCVEQFVAAW